MELFFDILWLLLGLALLIEGPDHLLEGTSSLAKKYNLSEITLGLSIVAFATSVPELTVSAIAHLQGETNLAFASIIGSNIFNLFIILGISGIFSSIKVFHKYIWRDILVSIVITITVLFLINDSYLFNQASNELDRIDAFILFAIFFVFLIFLTTQTPEKHNLETQEVKDLPFGQIIRDIIIGFITISAGGFLAVNQSLEIGQSLGKSSEFIAIVILAPGTSLPELATCILSLRKRRNHLIISNVIGSNIYNLTFILPFTASIGVMSYQQYLNTDLITLILGSIFLFFAIHSKKQKSLGRFGAFILLNIASLYLYAVYIRG